MRYATFVVPLVKAVQELSEQNSALAAENTALREELDSVKQAVWEMIGIYPQGRQGS